MRPSVRSGRLVLLGNAVLAVSPQLATADARAAERVCEPPRVTAPSELPAQWEGSTHPEMIPEFLKYRVFELMYGGHQDDLAQQLSARDHAILSAVAAESEHWQSVEGERYGAEFLRLCLNKAAFDPVGLAREYERAARASNDRTAARMRRAIESLSPTGESAVRAFIAGEVTPRLSHPREDSADLAMRDPGSFMLNFDIMCHVQMYGEPPPEVRRSMECRKQHADLERSGDDASPKVGLFPMENH